jgi:ABC-2 type transport system permease protein
VTALLATELRRFAARRAIRLLLAGALVLVVVVNAVQLARAEQTTLAVHDARVDRVPAECVLERRPEPVLDASCAFRSGADVLFIAGPPAGKTPVGVDVLLAEARDTRPHVGRTLEQTIRGIGMALVVLGLLLGATFLGGDYGTSLSTQLLFEPRRRRVFTAKWWAVGAGTALVAAVVLVSNGAAQWVISALRGTTDGVDGAWVARRALDVLRVTGACALAAMLAMAITAFVRRTVATVVGLFGALIVGQFLGGTAWGRTILRLVPTTSLWGVAIGRFHTEDRRPFGGLHTVAGAWTLALVWGGVGLVVGAWWFARQEVR